MARCRLGSGKPIVLAARMLTAGLLLFLGACAGNAPILENPTNLDLSARHARNRENRADSSSPRSSRGKYEVYPGQDALTPPDPPLTRGTGVSVANGLYLINLDGASIQQAAKLVLGDTLKANYVIDPEVQGTITLSTSRRLSEDEMLKAFESALALSGAVLIRQDGRFKIAIATDAAEGEMGSAEIARRNGQTRAGYGVSVVALRNVDATDIMQLVDSFVVRNGGARASASGNLVLIRGTATERQALSDIVLSFDVDWMRGQSASLAILANSAPADVVSQLQEIYGANGKGGGVRFVALDRLNAVLVLANSQQKVKRAVDWVARLDRPNEAGVDRFVYTVQNAKANDLARILNASFAEGKDTGAASDVAPDQAAVEGQTTTPDTTQPAESAGDAGGVNGKTDKIGGDETSASTGSPQDFGGLEAPDGVRIIPNPANNTLLIRATRRDYSKILSLLRDLDKPGVQVQINTTIAEVVLNDSLRYGVQAYFRSNDVAGGLFEGNSLTLRPSFPGLNFIYGSVSDPKVVLDALSAVTNVRVVSSPSVAVLENEPAVIKVGEQVPITIQQVVGTTVPNAPIVNSIEYRDAGVILKVTPRVNSTGLVTMQVEQELSAVARTNNATLTPTITQRSITSTVAVYSEQTVVLGGLISTQDSRSKDSLPVINQIPLIGDLFGKTDNTSRRSELIVFITPKVIRDSEDASRVSQELRDKLRLFDPH